MAESQQEMQYRFLGPTGLKVSVFGFGNWVTANDQEYQQTQNQIFKKCWDLGINFYDTAEVYGSGQAEESFGISIKELNAPRQDLVISTKIFWGESSDPNLKNQVNRSGLSRKHIIEGTMDSLRRMQLDYADIIFCHRYDHITPLEETIRAFNWLIENGKLMYWGTSEWSAENLKEAIGESNRLGLIKPVADQCQYSLICRRKVETEYADLFDRYRLGTTIWSPLASGLLTGKYNNGIPPNSRLGSDAKESEHMDVVYGDWLEQWFGEKNFPKSVEKLNNLANIAKEVGCSLSQLAIAWVVKNPNVSTCLLGASKVSQIEDNVKSLQFVDKITPEIEARINQIMGTQPQPNFDWKTFKPLQPRR
eukprot:TRINITY_DN131_c0_g2_i1.p1 TRINITY_DN131_c0_g2~~TRINITY_DN131_c0_g2_i1.p1  ORF type:complete len:364 (+),score=65.52 TRINITY_DN131_c0_g2_i1:121-1212(+)